MRLPSVLFPEPLLPTIKVISPDGKKKFDSLRMGFEGYAKLTCWGQYSSLLAS
jgi:hypothetical protein